jgi:hypothetical protein
VVKINNKRKLKYYLKDYDSGKSSQKSAAKAEYSKKMEENHQAGI